MYPAVNKVTPGEDYTLHIDFDNGVSGVLDMKPVLELGVFQQLKDDEQFKRVRVKFDTIEWDCGVDLDPEYIYDKCIKSETV